MISVEETSVVIQIPMLRELAVGESKYIFGDELRFWSIFYFSFRKMGTVNKTSLME